MKIRINYDLLDKIREQNTGFSVIRTRRDNLRYTIVFLPIDLLIASGDVKQVVATALVRLIWNSIMFPLVEKCVFPGFNKNRATMQLKELAILLKEQYVNTDYELLQEAYEYETNYKFILDDDKIPRLKQEKYIMVPVVDRDGEKEVSLVQEHLIGSNDYELSYGSPSKSKVLKPVSNGI